MKKILCSLLCIAGVQSLATAQTTPYPYQNYFATKTEVAYTPLTSEATEVIFSEEGPEWDDDFSDPITLPFPFKFNGFEISEIIIESNGVILYDLEAFGLMMYNADLEAGANLGKVYYQAVGTAPNRKFVIEFRNVSTYMNYTGNDTVNFQIVMNESSNIIELITGYCNIPSYYIVQEVDELDGDKEWLTIGVTSNEGAFISEDPTNKYFHTIKPTTGGAFEDTLLLISDLDEIEDDIIYALHNQFPPMGTKYRFIPTTYSSAKDLLTAADIQLFPNPAATSIQIKHQYDKAFQYNIYDVTGKIIMSGNLSNSEAFIEIENLSAGNYLLELYNESHNGAFKFVKK